MQFCEDTRIHTPDRIVHRKSSETAIRGPLGCERDGCTMTNGSWGSRVNALGWDVKVLVSEYTASMPRRRLCRRLWDIYLGWQHWDVYGNAASSTRLGIAVCEMRSVPLAVFDYMDAFMWSFKYYWHVIKDRDPLYDNKTSSVCVCYVCYGIGYKFSPPFFFSRTFVFFLFTREALCIYFKTNYLEVLTIGK